MAKIGQMLLNGGAYGDMRFFRPQVLESAMPRSLEYILGPGGGIPWGYGLCRVWDKRFSDKAFGHGAMSGALFRVDPGNDLVVVVTRNRWGGGTELYQDKFIQAILDGFADKAVGSSH